MAHVREAIAAIEPNDSVERFTGLGVKVIAGVARFTDAQTLQVGETEIRARRFVVATGSRPALPPIPNLIAVPYLTNETIFELKRLPGHLIVIGGGPIGIEMAQAFRRLGSAVTVLEAEKALAKDNPELTALLLQSLRAEGIDIREGAKVTRVARRGRSGVRVTLEGPDDTAPHIDGTHLLLATGRRPDLDELALEKARVRFDAKGIRVNSRLRTRNRRVYAIGDVVGGPQFTHWAGYQAGLVVRSILFRFGGKVRRDILPWVTFTEPELAHVGLSEEEARRRYRHLQVLRWPFAENDRAQTEGDRHGTDAAARHQARTHRRRRYPRARRGRVDRALRARRGEGAERKGLRDRDLPLSDARGGGAPRGDRLLCAEARFAADPPRDPAYAEARMSALGWKRRGGASRMPGAEARNDMTDKLPPPSAASRKRSGRHGEARRRLGLEPLQQAPRADAALRHGGGGADLHPLDRQLPQCLAEGEARHARSSWRWR